MRIFITGLLLLLTLSGCKATIHSGTANAFDSNTYDILLTTDNVIQTTRGDLVSGTVPASIQVNVKKSLNDLIIVYNALDQIYCGQPISQTAGGVTTLQCASGLYHASAMSGATTANLQTLVQNAITAVQTAVTGLTAAKAGN